MVLSSHELIVLLSTLVGSALAVNFVAQVLKKLFKLKTDSVIHTMVVAVSAVAGFAQYSVQIKSQLPPEVLGISATSIYGFSQVFFKYAQYAQGFITRVNTALAAQSAQTTANKAVAAVVAPTDAQLDEKPAAATEFPV